jgi:hypothetical protein
MVLNLQRGRRRFTYELISAALNLAGVAGQRFKHHFRVARPADRSSLIQPLLLTPGHGSYPAGHAVQTHMLKQVLGKLVNQSTLPQKLQDEIYSELGKLAARISENRVVAGLHYKTDIDQGQALGEKLGDYLVSKTANSPALNWLWGKAVYEWQS